jgi:hypothetical protein
MRFTTDNPYRHDVYTIKQYGEHTVKIAYCSTMRESGWEDDRKHKAKCSVNDDKLPNNLARAKNTVREYALCNPWDWWCTFTIDKEKQDRYDLDLIMHSFGEWIHNYNRRCPDEHKVKYVVVPEKHKDGAWHFHGFIRGIRPSDLYVNEHGYMCWKQYEKKFGYISMSKIQDLDKASSYVLKYMTKDTEKNVTELNRHLYYSSKGLEKATELYRGKAEFVGDWDWEHPDGYCKIKNLDVRKDNLHDYIEVLE